MTLRSGRQTAWDISVSNEGPTLPAEMQDHLFDPMVSLREQQRRHVHLGLGLHIVRLIVIFTGQVRADNRRLTASRAVLLTLLIAASWNRRMQLS